MAAKPTMTGQDAGMTDDNPSLHDDDQGPAVSATDEAREIAHSAARAQYAARRSYKRALRQARNPLYFSFGSLALMLVLVIAVAGIAIVGIFAMRSEPEAPLLEPVVEIVSAPIDLSQSTVDEESRAAPTAAEQIILPAETPVNLGLAGPAIPTVVITNTPVPLHVGVQAAVFGVGNDELNVRNIPSLTDSQILFRAPEGTRFDIIGGPQEADGFSWWQLHDTQFQVKGWAVANYLQTVDENSGS